MAKIFWLASYPKSGNTWMRVLLTNYLRNAEQPADINKLDGGPIASARTWFDEWVGIEASSLDDDTIEALRPGVYRCMAREEQQTIFMKVHDAWGVTGTGEPLFPPEITGGVIYILRNPLDMVASCASHWGFTLNKAAESLCDTTFALHRTSEGLADQLRQRLSCWSGHVTSWLDASRLPVHLVTYEDMCRNPEETFGAVVRFCGLPYCPERVTKTVFFSSFGELLRQEQINGFQERSPNSQGTFFRQGKFGSWREELPPDLVARIIKAHSKSMQRFGYT